MISIHGKKDRIVPFKNSLYLQNVIDKDKFVIVPLEKGSHALIWTDFDKIKSEILKVL